MKTTDIVLWAILSIGLLVAFLAWRLDRTRIENFEDSIDFTKFSTQARDAAPTTSEVKNHYKALLLYSNDRLQSNQENEASKALCILGSIRDALYDHPNFRSNLVPNDIIANWPPWLPPLDPTIKEPIPAIDAAKSARMKILAYIQKNFPQADTVDEGTGSTLRNLYTDFGTRFVFDDGETVSLRKDLLLKPLTNNIPSC
jgi:hypothetical protein